MDSKIKRRDELNEIINLADFWNSNNREEILKEHNNLNGVIENVESLNVKIKSNLGLLDENLDDEMLDLISNEYEEINSLVEKLRLETYLSGEYDKNDCILEIHPGAGGTESCDWALMLYRMYTKYLLKNDYQIVEMDKQPGDEAGIKSVMIQVSGNNAYGYLKGERGIHRLVRISPFDSNKRRHTSFASVEITPKFDDTISVEVNDNDIRIDIFRSSGPGGQGVNTTDSAVRITHIPTGIVVTCQNERSQIRNKEIAMEILRSKLYNLELANKNNQISEIKGIQMSNGFGSAKRSYVMCPYTLVKDNESGYETSNIDRILDGDIGEMLEKNIRR